MLGRLFKRAAGKSSHLVGVAMDDDTALAIWLKLTPDGAPQASAQFSDRLDKLDAWVADNGLAGARTALVLEPGAYMVQQFERPDLPEEDLRNALRWKLKDLLDYSPGDAVVDYFVQPPNRQRRNDMVQVVAARRTLIKPRLTSLEGAGLSLQRIDIPEFTLRNLVSRALRNTETTALLYLQDARGLLVVCRDDQLYIARTLDYGTRRLGTDNAQLNTWNDTDDRIALEIQRTMDYYDSHFGQAPVKRLVLAGDHPSLDRLAKHAANVLGIESEVASSDSLCAGAGASGHELLPLAIGAALGLE